MLGEARSAPEAVAAATAHVAGASLAKASTGISEPGPLTELDGLVEVAWLPSDGAALGKHEELAPLEANRCTCGPAHLRLRSNHGELVRVRGKSVNKCEYCAQLAAVENCEMLVMDALNGSAPQLLSILTTRTATLDMSAFAHARKKVLEHVRRRWPLAEFAYEVEFTTGYGPRSGGVRRPHWNYFWKGVPVADLDEFAELVIAIWCRYVDAVPAGQYVAEINNAIGLTKYVTEHFMKASQRPPAGFTGQRFNCSRGYFGESVTVTTARARARESIRSKRELWKALQRGLGPHDAELAAREALELSYRTTWVLANERGAQLSATIHDPRRSALISTWRKRPALLRELRELLAAGIENETEADDG